MHVQPLGTGGAFDAYETCYLVNDSILVDCGASSIKQILGGKCAGKITHIFLSHIHADHIGGFEALYYYRKYVTKSPITKVYCPAEFEAISRNSAYGKEGASIKYELLSNGMTLIDTPFGRVAVEPFRVQHSKLDAYGFIFNDIETNKVLIISGDTDTAIQTTREFDLLFHDIGWEGIPESEDAHKVHPRESEVLAAFGPGAPVIVIHTSQELTTYPKAIRNKIYTV